MVSCLELSAGFSQIQMWKCQNGWYLISTPMVGNFYCLSFFFNFKIEIILKINLYKLNFLTYSFSKFIIFIGYLQYQEIQALL